MKIFSSETSERTETVIDYISAGTRYAREPSSRPGVLRNNINIIGSYKNFFERLSSHGPDT